MSRNLAASCMEKMCVSAVQNCLRIDWNSFRCRELLSVPNSCDSCYFVDRFVGEEETIHESHEIHEGLCYFVDRLLTQDKTIHESTLNTRKPFRHAERF
jgi:hypothetical protein